MNTLNRIDYGKVKDNITSIVTGILIGILITLLCILSYVVSLNKTIIRAERRLHFIQGILADYDRDMQFEKWKNDERPNRYEFYYNSDEWSDLKPY